MEILFFALIGLMLLSLLGMLSDNDKLCHFSGGLYKSVLIALII